VTWFAVDTNLPGDRRMVELLDRHGTGAGWAWICLLARTKERGRAGQVDVPLREFAAAAFLDQKCARAVLESMAEVGLIDLHGVTQASLTVTVCRWQKYQREAKHQLRQARYRERQTAQASPDRHATVTESSPSVTPPSPTGTGTRTETETTSRSGSSNRSGKTSRSEISHAAEKRARTLLDAFNQATGSRFSANRFVLAIARRLREHPELSDADHRSVIERNLANPWWDGAPSPSVIWGSEEQFERSMHEDGRRGEHKADRQVRQLDELGKRMDAGMAT